jgi:hypothetical protein
MLEGVWMWLQRCCSSFEMNTTRAFNCSLLDATPAALHCFWHEAAAAAIAAVTSPLTGDAHDWRVQLVKRLLLHNGCDLRAHAMLRPPLLHADLRARAWTRRSARKNVSMC